MKKNKGGDRRWKPRTGSEGSGDAIQRGGTESHNKSPEVGPNRKRENDGGGGPEKTKRGARGSENMKRGVSKLRETKEEGERRRNARR